MSSRSSDFLYKDDFDTIIEVIDVDVIQNNGELTLQINPCFKNMLSKNKSSFQREFNFLSSGSLKRHQIILVQIYSQQQKPNWTYQFQKVSFEKVLQSG